MKIGFGIKNSRIWAIISIICAFYGVISCDNKDDIEIEVVDQTGTDIKSFSLTDGISEYHSFATIDSLILVKVPNQSDLTKLKANFKHNGKDVSVKGIIQQSGISVNNFSDSTNPVVYTVTSISGESKNYTILLFDIPVIRINTENNIPITNKEDWIPAKISILDDNGGLVERDIQIKGRGNASWRTNRQSYSLKFSSKESLFSLPSSKRWVLIGQAGDWTRLRSALSFKLSKIAGFEWSPSGYNVEFILNDSLKCNYFFCEQIRVEKNRINIKEMTPTDTLGVELTGGVLFEVSSDYDELFKFRSEIGDFPFMFKNPDKDLHPIQFEYFKDYINKIESLLYSDLLLSSDGYLEYIDIDSFIRWWLVMEMTMNMEESYYVKNYYMYKDRGYEKKLTAGPPWDWDWGTYWKKNENRWLCKNKFWYSRLFLNPTFVKRVKEIWNEIKSSYYDNNIDSFYNSLQNYNRFSVLRDNYLYPKEFNEENAIKNDWNDDDGMPYEEASQYIKQTLDNHLIWMDKEINNL